MNTRLGLGCHWCITDGRTLMVRDAGAGLDPGGLGLARTHGVVNGILRRRGVLGMVTR